MPPSLPPPPVRALQWKQSVPIQTLSLSPSLSLFSHFKKLFIYLFFIRSLFTQVILDWSYNYQDNNIMSASYIKTVTVPKKWKVKIKTKQNPPPPPPLLDWFFFFFFFSSVVYWPADDSRHNCALTGERNGRGKNQKTETIPPSNPPPPHTHTHTHTHTPFWFIVYFFLFFFFFFLLGSLLTGW